MFYAGLPGFKQPPFYIHESRVQRFACCPVLTKSKTWRGCIFIYLFILRVVGGVGGFTNSLSVVIVSYVQSSSSQIQIGLDGRRRDLKVQRGKSW